MKAYHIKIELIDSQTIIWRRVIIPADVTFKRLHDTIQLYGLVAWRLLAHENLGRESAL